MSVLSRQAILEHIAKAERNYEDGLIVTPLLSVDQIGPASIDIRLGSSIIIPKNAYIESQDVTNRDVVQQVETRRYDRLRLQYHHKFILHPGELILACTFEYLSLPKDLFSMVASRSSWGRLGLVVATAAIVQPGFKGCLTLELANVSASPIALYPGLCVGQLVFHETTAEEKGLTEYTGRYDCPTEAGLPEFSGPKFDQEIGFWGSTD